ncbi:uncharacterized protein LOC132720637 [Ruditapes philippinarum]|uniref:uncharacterized protein LOC132720637 n=1 Tax=Ruditapes philippinarum TaxID=129788 RepID=UPI00295B1DD4|nr:uncharacterized protein LOC132720637 [Ruditapes philippinarum]
MKKLKVSLPAIERALKSHVSTNITRQKQDDDKKQTKKKTTKSSKERVRKYREKLKNDPVYKQKLLELKEKKKTENKAYKSKQKLKRENDENFDRECKVKQRKWTKDSRKRKSKTLNIETANTNGQVRYSCKKKVDQHSTLRKRAERVRKSLPEDSNYWAKTMSHIIKHATPKRRSLLNLSTSSPGTENLLETLELRRQGRPNKEQAGAKKKLAFSEKSTSLWNSKKSLNEYKRRKNKQAKRLSKTTQFKKSWMPKLLSFLDEHSRTMPNKKDTILIDGRHVAKRHLLCTKLELFKSFKAIHPDYSRRFSTFKKMIPKNFKRLDLTCRRVCVCTKDFNFEQKVEALNKIAQQQSMPLLKATPKQLSNLSLCPYEDIPKRSCVDRQCVDCGTAIVVNTYEPLVQACGNSVVAKYYQWESSKESYISKDGDKKHTTRWIQAEKTCSVADLVHDIAKSLESHSSHLFRANFQYKMESLLTSDLPLDHCLVVMDFSENISLQPQDEIESAHWTTKQVTLHPVFIVRHDPQRNLTSRLSTISWSLDMAKVKVMALVLESKENWNVSFLEAKS